MGLVGCGCMRRRVPGLPHGREGVEPETVRRRAVEGTAEGRAEAHRAEGIERQRVRRGAHRATSCAARTAAASSIRPAVVPGWATGTAWDAPGISTVRW